MATAVLAPTARQQFFDNDGLPLAGGRLYTYAAGTDLPRAIYTNAALTVAHPNPAILDGAGRITIYLPEFVAFKFILKDAFDALIWEVDPVPSSSSLGDSTEGIHDLFIPALAFQPRLGSGPPCGSHVHLIDAVSSGEIISLPFNFNVDNNAFAWIGMPTSWDGQGVSVEVFWVNAAGGSGNVYWAIYLAVGRPGVKIFPGSPATWWASISLPSSAITANVIHSVKSAVLSISDPTQVGNLMFIHMQRNGANALDSYEAVAHFMGLNLRFTTDAPTDD